MKYGKTLRQNGDRRNAYWDNIKGILILLTVFSQILWANRSEGVVKRIVDCIYLFHMPALAFVFGALGKDERLRGFKAVARILLRFFVFNGVTGFILGFDSLLIPLGPLWFLLALAAWRISAPHLSEIKHIRILLLCAAIIAGFYDSIDNTLAISRIICFYPFYMAGYLLTSERAQAVKGQKYRARVIKAAAFLLAAAVIAAFASRSFRYGDAALTMGAYKAFPRDMLGRFALIAVASLMILALRYGAPNRPLPLLTCWGRNFLHIYSIHFLLTALICRRIDSSVGTATLFAMAAIGALLICLIFGSDRLSNLFDLNPPSNGPVNRAGKGLSTVFVKLAVALVCLGYAVLLFIHPSPIALRAAPGSDVAGRLSMVFTWLVVALMFLGYTVQFLFHSAASRDASDSDAAGDVMYPAMTSTQRQRFDDAFRITFAGDLILLEDQVKRARIGDTYDFSPVFEYAKKYISSADFAIGVFEGPMAGKAAGYSSSNYGDGKALALNFPDAFAEAVKGAGFDLVTTANNHVLDKGPDGARRTLDVLDRIGLDHTGSYRNAEEKRHEHIKLVDVDGIRMAILSYTYGANGRDSSQLIDGELSYVTSVAFGTEGAQFKQMKALVEQDFAEARALKPDLIIVLPHLGTQFTNDAVPAQKVWFDIFKKNGADIILGDHPHAVEPARIEECDGRSVFAAYCPGNFANIYRKHQGDTSMLIDVYVDRNSKEVIGGSVVPLYTQSQIDGNYRALPVFDIVNDPTLRSTLSTDDYERAANANGIVTRVVFGHEMDVSSVTERYYFDSNGFIRTRAGGLALDDRMKGGMLYRAISDASSVCFVGDSVTEGTKNGGCPWYEPMEQFLDDKKILNYSKGSSTVASLTERMNDVPPPVADLYLVAIGTNDVRYRNAKICAMTSESYVERIDAMRRKLLAQSGNAQFIFIAPWYSTDGDRVSRLPFPEKTQMNAEYAEALKRYCEQNKLGYIDANPYIREALNARPDRHYLIDYIHPNASAGVVLYSEAVLNAQ